jgi:hypothetical protein
VKHKDIIPIAVYKRSFDDTSDRLNGFGGQGESHSKDKNNRKPYVWLHPPRDAEISPNDELFVLCDKNPEDAEGMMKARGKSMGAGGQFMKDEEKKTLNDY